MFEAAKTADLKNFLGRIMEITGIKPTWMPHLRGSLYMFENPKDGLYLHIYEGVTTTIGFYDFSNVSGPIRRAVPFSPSLFEECANFLLKVKSENTT